MESKNTANGTAFILVAFTLLAAIAGAFSLEQIIPHLNRWQIASYAIVAGIFIAVSDIILVQILKFFTAE